MSHAAKIISHAPISLKRLLGKTRNSGRQEQGGREVFTSSDGDKQVKLAFFGRDLRGLARGTWNGPTRRDDERMRRLRGINCRPRSQDESPLGDRSLLTTPHLFACDAADMGKSGDPAANSISAKRRRTRSGTRARRRAPLPAAYR